MFPTSPPPCSVLLPYGVLFLQAEGLPVVFPEGVRQLDFTDLGRWFSLGMKFHAGRCSVSRTGNMSFHCPPASSVAVWTSAVRCARVAVWHLVTFLVQVRGRSGAPPSSWGLGRGWLLACRRGFPEVLLRSLAGVGLLDTVGLWKSSFSQLFFFKSFFIFQF